MDASWDSSIPQNQVDINFLMPLEVAALLKKCTEMPSFQVNMDEICWVGWVGRVGKECLGTNIGLSRNLWSSFLLEWILHQVEDVS